MKHLLKLKSITFLLACLFSFSLNAQEINLTDSTGLPGDHFSLEGALELFKNAKSPEAFEKSLNQSNNNVNNLDLNEDGDIDYIRVIDNMENEVHAIVLQVPINDIETQDIAVIEIEKNGDASALLQIIGDESLYGEGAIVEPFEEVTSGGKGGPNPNEFKFVRVVVNVWLWPSVRYVYAPRYKVWVSPFRWKVYPRWWKPWRPHPWRWHHTHCVHFRTGFRLAPSHRLVRAHKVYTPHRRTSKLVVSRTVVRRNKGTKVYRRTAVTRTTQARVHRPNGRVVTGTRTTTQVRGKGKNNKVAGKKTTTTVRTQGRNGRRAAKRTTKKTVVRKRH